MYQHKATIHFYRVLAMLLLIMMFTSCRDLFVEEKPEIEHEFQASEKADSGSIVISEDYHHIDWEDPTNSTVSADPESGKFVIKMDKKKARSIQPGELLTIDADSTGYLRRVVSTDIHGDEISLETEPATMDELFEGSRFMLCLEPGLGLETRSETGDDGMLKIYPSEIGIRDNNGCSKMVPVNDYFRMMEESKTRGDTGIEITLWENEETEGNISMWIGEDDDKYWAFKFHVATGDIPFDKQKIGKHGAEFTSGISGTADLTLGLKAQLYSDLSMELNDEDYLPGVQCPDCGKELCKLTEEIGLNDDNEVECKCEGCGNRFTYLLEAIDAGKTLAPGISLKASLETNITFKSNIEKEYGDEDDKELFTKTLLSLKFVIGVVPVWIDFNLSLSRNIHGSFSGGVEVPITTKLEWNGAHLGMKVEDRKGEQTIKSTSTSGKFKVTKVGVDFNVSDKVTWENTFSLIPKFEFALYGVAGPFIGFAPEVTTTLNLGLGIEHMTNVEWEDDNLEEKAITSDTKPFIGWDFGADLGTKIKFGIDGKFFKSSKSGDNLKKPEKTLDLTDERPIITLPSDFSILNAFDAKVGEECVIDVQTLAHLIGYGEFNCPVPVAVMFQTPKGKELTVDGKKTSYVYTHSEFGFGKGKASISWTPQSDDSRLMVAVYGASGAIKEPITIHPSHAPSNAKGVDLGLPSHTIWANMNVGAEDEEWPGDYVGWGDPTGKNKAQWEKEEYGKYESFSPEVLQYYGGYDRSSGIEGGSKDYASKQWGGGWKTPTKAQWEELITKCKWEFNESDRQFIISGNGNSIILPAAGCYIGETSFRDPNYPAAEYWSASIDKDTKEKWMFVQTLYPRAYFLLADPLNKYGKDGHYGTVGTRPRCYRAPIRPVFKE